MRRRIPLACAALLLVPFLLGSAERVPPQKPESKLFHLKLHVPAQSGIYFSAWGDGKDAVSAHDGSDGKTVTYRRRFYWYDNCLWDSTETLTPITRNEYKYEYREWPGKCPKGDTADSGAITPRDGTVTVHPADDDRPITPLFAWSTGWEKPNH
jgi:hypothetical protein